MKSFAVMRQLRGRKARIAVGKNRNAQVTGGWVRVGLFFSAVVLGVAMVRVKALVMPPGGRVGGLKEAVARLGRPVAARVIGLDMLP